MKDLVKKMELGLFFLFSHLSYENMAIAEITNPIPMITLKPISKTPQVKNERAFSLLSGSFVYDRSFTPLLANTEQLSLHLYSPKQKKFYRLEINLRKSLNIWLLPKDYYQVLSIDWLSLKHNRLTWKPSNPPSQKPGDFPQSKVDLSTYRHFDLGSWALGLHKEFKNTIRNIRPAKPGRPHFTATKQLSQAQTQQPKAPKQLLPRISKPQPLPHRQRLLSASDIIDSGQDPRYGQLKVAYFRKRQVYMAYRIKVNKRFTLSNQLTTFLERHDSRFRSCYLDSLERQAHISGYIIYSFSIATQPAVIEKPILLSSNLTQTGLVNCIATELQGLVLPAGGGRNASITFQLDVN